MDILFLYKKIRTQVGRSIDVDGNYIFAADIENIEMRTIGKTFDMVLLMDGLTWDEVPAIAKLRIRCCMHDSKHKRVATI